MIKGIDVSEHQGIINWDKVKATGKVDFVMLRAGFGHNNIDKQFKRNIKECNRLGIPVGIYWFSYAYNCEMASNEAKFALEAVKGYRLDYPICFDLEYDSLRYAKTKGVTIDKRLGTDMVKAFCSVIEDNKYYAMNYSNQDFIKNHFYQEELERYALWYAYYNPSCNMKPGIWQYSESGKIAGINTDSVDMNYCYVDYPKRMRNWNLNNLGGAPEEIKPIPVPTPVNPNEIVKPLFNQHGTCTVLVDKLNIRALPSTDSEIVGNYSKGEQVSYDKVVYTRQYAWISWIGASSNRRYMAVRNRETNNKMGNCI